MSRWSVAGPSSLTAAASRLSPALDRTDGLGLRRPRSGRRAAVPAPALGATPLQLGIAAAIDTRASIAFLLLGGAIADRVPRRALIVASDLLGGCVVTLVALLSATGQLRIEHVYVAAVALGAADAFLRPAYTAIIADIVPADILRAGNAARLLGRSLARIVGPTVGGLAVALAGPALAFGINALTFFFSFGTLLLANPPRRVLAATTSLFRDIREGSCSRRSG